MGDTELSSNIDNEKRLEWTINNEIKQKLNNIHLSNNYNEVEEEIEINKNLKKYKIQIDNEFIVKYNYNLIENIDTKKNNNKIFFDMKDNKLNLISSKSNPILGSTKEHR